MPTADDLLSALDPEQRAVAQSLRGPVCVVAGAGTGKTRAITHRIAYGVATGVYKPNEVLAVTFTNRAAGEMRGRLRTLGAAGVQARTFHSAALRQARYFWPQVYGGDFPDLTRSKIPLLIEAVRRCGLRVDQAQLRDVAAEIEWAKVSNALPQEYAGKSVRAHREVSGVDAATIGNIFAAYEDIKRDRNRIDMEDILLVTAAILADDDRVAAQVRRQYRWFVVDEYQDVNPLQATLLNLWLGGRNDICVVGDPLQTIYSFAGASPALLGSFTATHPDGERHELVRNYRSTPQIIAAANAVFDQRTAVKGVLLQSQQAPGSPVTYAGYPDEPAEAAAVVGKILSLHGAGMPYKEMAVLFRINAQSEAFEEALGHHAIPYVVRGVDRFFERPEVRQAITLLRGAAHAGQDDGDMSTEVTNILSGIGYTAKAPTAAGAVRDRWESLHALVSMTADLAEADPAATLNQLVDDLDRRAANANAPAADGVTLATMHSAKGLEWDAVFCVGMHEGMMPSVHAQSPGEVEEERRLFYVGITRARRDLLISWAAARNPGGRGARKPTRFLDSLLPANHEARLAGRPARERKAAHCRVCNHPLVGAAERKRGRHEDCAPQYDEALFEALRAWRKDQAAEQKVPAYVIFTDATLLGIAESKPQDLLALNRIAGIGRAKLDRYGADVLRLCAVD